MIRKRAATIIDVAKQANVSIGTVSNVLNHAANVSEKTKRKVEEAIGILSYSPNDAARSIRTGRTHSIGIVVPDIMNEYYAKTIQALMDAAYKENYTALITCFKNRPQYEEKLLNMLIDRRVEAIGIMGGVEDNELVKEVAQKVPVLLIDRRIEGSGLSAVQFDNCSALMEMVAVLKEAGYRKIGYMSETLAMTNIADRYQGFLQAMKGNGLAVDESCVWLSKDLQLEKNQNGYKLMKKILNERKRSELPEVLLTSSDLIAVGVMDAVKEAGFRIPHDIGIVGFDNITLSNHTFPTLTTVEQDMETIGKTSWDVIRQLMKRRTKIVHEITLEQGLVFRDSCKLPERIKNR
ncbi:LacI family DNA-binding transcriptional regulator [Christensenella tenuis]|uniref:LacI family DNA-binding transcriptional regulator n=1 Tax=Christensenella tenuis TaxID=2763033 RepID=A0ABR7ECW0_9FIRM|nr:LacI family DNA-binding transcriptional regulator [Christensenella tenuis]MBC5647621.1 LacI family DNA-binding transcriptional regulator [Christensenella tenuis]